jgi:uncharacterized RDD family membrane protein YckC
MDDLNSNDKPLPPFLFKKASVGTRLGAFLIDHFIFSFVLVFIFTFGLFGMMSENIQESAIVLFFFIFMMVVFLVYGLRDTLKGQSIGKRVFGIGVRDISDNFAIPSVSRLFLRQIFSFMWPIEFLVLVFSTENRKIGDLMAGTGVYNLREYEDFVLYTKRMAYINQTPEAENLQNIASPSRVAEPYKPKKAKIAIIIMGVMLAGILFVGALVFGITSIFKNHPSYHVATDSIKTNPEIVALIGEIESFGFMPSGNISTSPGRGDASFSIRARGTHGEVRVFVALQMRDGGDWEIVSFNFSQISSTPHPLPR